MKLVLLSLVITLEKNYFNVNFVYLRTIQVFSLLIYKDLCVIQKYGFILICHFRAAVGLCKVRNCKTEIYV